MENYIEPSVGSVKIECKCDISNLFLDKATCLHMSAVVAVGPPPKGIKISGLIYYKSGVAVRRRRRPCDGRRRLRRRGSGSVTAAAAHGGSGLCRIDECSCQLVVSCQKRLNLSSL